MRMKKITVFLYVPVAFLRGEHNLKRFEATREINVVKLFIRNSLMNVGFKHVNIHCFDPVIHTWNTDWDVKVHESDAHLYYISQDHSSYVGRGFFDSYKKYEGLKEQRIIYRRKIDDTLNLYRIDHMSEKYGDDWNNYADLAFGVATSFGLISDQLRLKYKGDEQFEPPENLKKYQGYQTVRIYHCVF